MADACLMNRTNTRITSPLAVGLLHKCTRTSPTSPYFVWHSVPTSATKSSPASPGSATSRSTITLLGLPRKVTGAPAGRAAGGGGGGVASAYVGGAPPAGACSAAAAWACWAVGAALAITAVPSRRRFASRGVVIPCPSRPRPWPCAQPNLCMMARPGSCTGSRILSDDVGVPPPPPATRSPFAPCPGVVALAGSPGVVPCLKGGGGGGGIEP
mmetsp:Transcript_666/g.1806  ORF Transcript_666/g.1806 Transcript_666/m.1806 type:complete len:213 (+) Transcript_666:243-881(+)